MPRLAAGASARDQVDVLRKRLDGSFQNVDPHRRLAGRPVTFRVIAGRTLQITYRDVLRVDEAELAGVQKLLGEGAAFSVTPQTAETMTVRFVVPLRP